MFIPVGSRNAILRRGFSRSTKRIRKSRYCNHHTCAIIARWVVEKEGFEPPTPGISEAGALPSELLLYKYAQLVNHALPIDYSTSCTCASPKPCPLCCAIIKKSPDLASLRFCTTLARIRPGILVVRSYRRASRTNPITVVEF